MLCETSNHKRKIYKIPNRHIRNILVIVRNERNDANRNQRWEEEHAHTREWKHLKNASILRKFIVKMCNINDDVLIQYILINKNLSIFIIFSHSSFSFWDKLSIRSLKNIYGIFVPASDFSYKVIKFKRAFFCLCCKMTRVN